jgi:hypothetical protein
LAYCSVRCHAAGSSSPDGRVDRRLVGGDLDGRDLGRANRPLEESVGFLLVAPRRDEYVDDLPELIDSTVDVPPPSGDLHTGLIHLPAVADGVPARRAASASNGVNRWTHR